MLIAMGHCTLMGIGPTVATSASPTRYQCPVPVTASMPLMVAPYHATMRRVYGAVLATTSWGRPISGLSRQGTSS